MSTTDDKVVRYEVGISGDRLLMHNEQLANPFNEYAKALSKVTRKRGKAEDDHIEIARIEYQGGLYFDDKLGPYVPGRCIHKMIVEGAKRRRQGMQFERMILVERDVNPVLYEGPRTRAELGEAALQGKFVDQRLVGIGDKRTLRTRPMFSPWALEFEVAVVDGDVDRDALWHALVAAMNIGLLDGRPNYGGRFQVDSFELSKKNARAA